MSLTVAAVQIPYHHPYQQGTFSSTSSSSSDIDSVTKRSTFELSSDIPRATPVKSARWSQSNYNEHIVEEQQMSNDGSAPRAIHDQSREAQAIRGSRAPPEHVLPPPMIGTGKDQAMDGRRRQSPLHSPKSRISDRPDYALERRGPRLHGVHSILNPSHAEEEDRRSRRRDASEMEGERRASYQHSSIATVSTGLNSFAGPPPSETSPPLQSGHRAMRRILTPISPRIHRAVSHGRLTGTIDATERPFLPETSRMATPEHSAHVSLTQLPSHTSQVTQQSPFIVPAAPTPPLIQPPLRRASVSVVGSARPSPSPSYADTYSQSGMSGQASPAMHPTPSGLPGPTPPGSMQMTPSPNIGPMGAVPPGSLDNEQGFHGPVVSSGQNYQILTVDTSKGHMQLPVEVQAASRVADEKRKRNAGASARFRARRKEKEREAASKISNLELELAYAQEDGRHYKAERDYLADIIYKYVPQYESHLKNRPPSPRHNRSHHVPRPSLASIDSPLSTVASEHYDSPEMDRPATRRRTETYTLPNVPQQHQYPVSPYTSYTPGPAQLPLPQQHASAHYAQPGVHSQGPPPPLLTRAPHDVHRSEQQPYDRNWPPRTGDTQR